MKAVVFDGPMALHVAELDRPEPPEGEALIEVGAAGVCAGDVALYSGKYPWIALPRIPGHEFAGRVVKLGPNTRGPALGSAVAVEPFIGCGRCYPCRVGKSNCCVNLRVIGMHRDGGFAGYVTAPVNRLHPVPERLSLFEAAFAEPVAVGVQCCRRGEVAAGETVLILGAGPIGLALIEVAHARGARTVITDINPARLEYAAELGATTIAAGEGLYDEVMRLTDGEGMPVVMEATGNQTVAEETARLVAAGGRIVIIGIIKGGAGVTFPGAELVSKEMTIVGSRASVNCFPESLDLLARGKIRYPEVATRFSLDQGATVFSDIVAGKPLHKAVFVAAA